MPLNQRILNILFHQMYIKPTTMTFTTASWSLRHDILYINNKIKLKKIKKNNLILLFM